MRFRAVETYCPNGWIAQLYSEHFKLWVDIKSSPLFRRPEPAITWARDVWYK